MNKCDRFVETLGKANLIANEVDNLAASKIAPPHVMHFLMERPQAAAAPTRRFGLQDAPFRVWMSI